ncbi:leucine-rich repeat (LRR) family protein [Actinidia rufa]|uniref:Cell wall hydroxyproline-rich glycoprotein n=1 Tax=Actinidia rufa TaxID=165716 RepID=A0A7J0ETV1_9ERIC|nr:leucine-rich repeat (LRR) family protein [Actinidia rufa]
MTYKQPWVCPRWSSMAYPPNMKALGCFFLFSLLLSSSLSLSSATLDVDVSSNVNGELSPGFEFGIDLQIKFENSRLKRAYKALQAWKKAIFSDPFNLTANWVGPDVCSYGGVFCAPALDDPSLIVVAGVDLNHGDIAGHLPPELELLTDIALFHINSNRFCGIIPEGINKLIFLRELDVSNNRFVGLFPKVVLGIPDLKYLDLRYNDFEGPLPPELFEKELDALFLNNNRFTSTIPETIGNSPISVAVFSSNKFSGCIPKSIGKNGELERDHFC